MTPDNRLGAPRHSRRRRSYWEPNPPKVVTASMGWYPAGFWGRLASDLGDNLRDPLEQSLRETNALAS